jgi:hypothetical protein
MCLLTCEDTGCSFVRFKTLWILVVKLELKSPKYILMNLTVPRKSHVIQSILSKISGSNVDKAKMVTNRCPYVRVKIPLNPPILHKNHHTFIKFSLWNINSHFTNTSNLIKKILQICSLFHTINSENTKLVQFQGNQNVTWCHEHYICLTNSMPMLKLLKTVITNSNSFIINTAN